LELNGKQLTTPLKSWEDLGTPSFGGPAVYRKQFNLPAVPIGKRVYLEIADVRDYARSRVNGAVFEAKAWQPYRWDITNSLQAGNNDVQINVFATSAGRGGPGGPPPGAAPARLPRRAAAEAGAAAGRAGRPRCRGHARWRISRPGWVVVAHPNAAGFGLARTSPSGSAVGARPLGLFLASGRAGHARPLHSAVACLALALLGLPVAQQALGLSTQEVQVRFLRANRMASSRSRSAASKDCW